MFRKLAVAVALALPLAGFAGGGALIKAAHAQGLFAPPQGSFLDSYCSTTYPNPPLANPAQGNPYYLYDCGQSTYLNGPTDVPGGGFNSNEPGGCCTDPFNDLSGEGIHWTGTAGSYAHFLCSVPSIVTGKEYATYSSAEIDISTSGTGYFDIMEQCAVQTPDKPGANLLAYLENGELCVNESNNGDPFEGEYDNNFYVTENATGLATVHCNFIGYDETD